MTKVNEQQIEFLQNYRLKLVEYEKIATELLPSDFTTPKNVLDSIPTVKEIENKLLSMADDIKEQIEDDLAITNKEHLKKYYSLLVNPEVRTNRAKELHLRKSAKAHRRAEKMLKIDNETLKVIQLANDNGFNGATFGKRYDDPTSQEAFANFNKQIDTIPQIIAKIKKPKDNSLISDDVKLLSVSQMARLLGWGESVVRQRNKSGILPKPTMIDGCIQWTKAKIEKWLEMNCPPREEFENRMGGF